MTTIAQAIANRNNARVDIVCIGDSITYGFQATTFGSIWPQQANQIIRALFPTIANGSNGGLGFIPFGDPEAGDDTYTFPISVTAGDPSYTNLGPTRYCSEETTGVTWEFTAPAGTTSVGLMYLDGDSAEITYQVNEGAPVNIFTGGTLAEILTEPIAMAEGDVLQVSGTSVIVDGIIHYAGDETSGITFHACGRPGWCAGTETDIGWNQEAIIPGFNWAQAFANGFPNPSALVFMLGINDGSTDNGDRTAPEYESDSIGLVTTVQESDALLADIPLIFGIEYDATGPGFSWADPGGWPAYVAAGQNIAAQYPGSIVVDLDALMLPVADDPGYYADDNLHPNDEGYAMIGRYFADAVAAAASGATSNLFLLTTGL